MVSSKIYGKGKIRIQLFMYNLRIVLLELKAKNVSNFFVKKKFLQVASLCANIRLGFKRDFI